MRNKKAKALRRVAKRQVAKQQGKDEFKNINLFEKRFLKVEKFAKQHLVLRDGKPEYVALIYTKPIKLDFCLRRVYQSLKGFLKYENKIKDVKCR